MKRNIKILISGLSAGALMLTSTAGADFITREEKKADAATPAAVRAGVSVTEELTAERSRFVKQFAMSDGSYTAVTYSMPAHYKKSGRWKEIDTTLVKSGNKKYKTKATDLSIKVSKKANKTSVVSLKRGKTGLSLALKGKKIRAAKAKISNPKKSSYTDVRNENTVTYKKVRKNMGVSYDIYPEKIQEIIKISKKQKRKALSFIINAGKLKVKVKGKKIYFKTKKGKTKFTRMSTKITDAGGVTTTKARLSYNKKKKTLTVTPDKKWWNSKKRKFPLEIRTTYLTDKHSRDVKVGAAYAGTPDSNFGYDKSLLLQAGKCAAFTKMSVLSGLQNKNVQIREAALHIKNEKTLKLGAGKTFDIGVHKVKQNWSVNKLTYNNRPAYEANASATMGIQKAGQYQCDVTGIVKAWYAGEANYGVALAADNSNRAYQAKIDRNPYFTIHYEIVGFDGAQQLKENVPLTRSVITAGQENYYYFDAKPGIAYDLYTESSIDTQAVMYDTNKERAGYDDNSGLDNNFFFTGSYNGRKYIKVSVKNKGTGNYTLHLKKRFAIPEPRAIKGQDKVTITWNAAENAKEYLVSIYEGGKKINEAVVTGTSYDYIYNNETAGKILGFTVTARENASLTGETSRMIFNTDSNSEWVYAAPMQEKRKNSSVAAQDKKIYVLGGENAAGSLKSFAVYDTEKKTWETLPDYPGTETGICKAAMFAYNNEIIIIGGQTGTGAAAKLLPAVYAFNTDTKQWQKKADMSEGRTNAAYAASRDSLYLWTKAGATNKAEIYDIKTDTWETAVMPDTSSIIDAAGVDNRVFVLKEDGEKMYWQEYLPEDNAWEEKGKDCPFAVSGKYRASAVIRGKIYMVKEAETKEVLVYDAYADEWSRISAMNLTKKDSSLAACGNDVYSIGGEMRGYGVLDAVEQYTVKVQSTTKEMIVKKGEAYELQVTAGNLKKGQTKVVTVAVNPDEMQIINASSFEEEDKLKEGADGVTLLKYQPKKGVLVLKLTGSLERGESFETYQSIPVEGKIDGKTKVEITLTEKSGQKDSAAPKNSDDKCRVFHRSAAGSGRKAVWGNGGIQLEFIKKRKTILTVTGIIVLFAIAGTVFFVLRSNPRDNKQKEGNQNGENYLSLSRPDRETADLYAELYEMSREDVARQQKKTGDWEKTAKELETAFFTIPENEKYQMAKQGYAPEDLEEAERLSTKTGRKAIELAKAKGKAADRRKWSQVVKDSEILTTEEQLGLTKEQVKALEKKSLAKEERVEVALLLMNGWYTFDEVMKKLDAGENIKEIKQQGKNG